MPLLGRKRSREEMGEEDEYLELLNPSKRFRLSTDSYVSRRRVIRPERRPQLRRSNSVDRFGERLSFSDRHTSNTGLKKESYKDFSVIGVFSREAFENFGKKWKAKMSEDTLSLATKSSLSRVSPLETPGLLGRQTKSTQETDFQKQIQSIFENKTAPHVIAVIEGKEESTTLSIKTTVGEKTLELPYTRAKYVQGTNAKGSTDNKQSMSIYVRDDMTDVYRISEESVFHKSGKTINALGVNYETKDGTSYRSLIVHIPNEFIGSSLKEADTHQAFKDYSEQQAKSATPVVVTSYVGDTNYSSSATPYSSPSMGGHSSSGETLNPQSSSAQKETHFMQSVPLSDKHEKHSLLQPSTLNYVFINPNSTNREATDHPSMMQYVAHDSELVGRNPMSSFEFLE